MLCDTCAHASVCKYKRDFEEITQDTTLPGMFEIACRHYLNAALRSPAAYKTVTTVCEGVAPDGGSAHISAVQK